MKTPYTLIGLLFASFSLVALAQDPFKEEDPFSASTEKTTPKMIQVQVEYIRLSHPALTKLLYQSKSKSADAGVLRDSLHKMVLKNEADVMETQIVTGKSGERSTSESIHEFIYPTEYEPIDLPAKTEEMLKEAMIFVKCNVLEVK